MVLRVLGPAGRKAVVVSTVFSNPYVDREQRIRAAERMYRALLDRDGNASGTLQARLG